MYNTQPYPIMTLRMSAVYDFEVENGTQSLN